MPNTTGSPTVESTPNLGAIGARRPGIAARGHVKNLLLEETGNPDFPHIINFPFRPTEVSVDGSVNNDSMDPMGMSHRYETYVNTDNAQVTFELFMNALMMIKETTSEGLSEGHKSHLNYASAQIQKYRRFLEALLYPGYVSPGTIHAQQPPCILCLPGIVTMRCKLNSLREVFKQCDIDGNPIELRMACSFREAPMGRISMEDVLTVGMFRTWGY